MARALLAEDEAAVRPRVRAILGELGCEVTEDDPLDLGVTDSLAKLRELRARHGLVPVVVIAASGRVAEAVAALRGGATDVVGRPFHEHELRDVLAAVLATELPAGTRLRAPGAVL